MKVSFSSNSLKSNTHQNFGAVKLDAVHLLEKNKKNIYKPVKANFYELETNCKKDIKLMKKLQRIWGKKTEYADAVCDSFLSQKDYTSRYFMIQTTESKKKITNIMQTEIDSGNFENPIFEVKYLQSAPDIANMLEPAVKGSGEVAMYEAVKMAQKGNWNSLVLFSSNNNFYNKLGLQKIYDIGHLGLFAITKENFAEFINKIKTKYKLK